MKSAERQKKLKSDVLVTVFETSGRSSSAIALAAGVSRPTATAAIDQLVKEGILSINKKGCFEICDSYRIVILKIDPEIAQLITVCCSDKNVNRIDLKPVESMSDSGNAARFAGIAERHIDELVRGKKTVLAITLTDSEDLCLPRTVGTVLERKEAVQRYLSCLSKSRSLLYLSANSPASHFYFGGDLVGSGQGKHRLDIGSLERVFDIITPDLLAIDGFYSLGRDTANAIRGLCERDRVELWGNERAELSIDELGAVRILLERYCET